VAEERAYERDEMQQAVTVVGAGAGATWRTSARARGEVMAFLLQYTSLTGLVQQYPEIAGDIRAGTPPLLLPLPSTLPSATLTTLIFPAVEPRK